MLFDIQQYCSSRLSSLPPLSSCISILFTCPAFNLISSVLSTFLSPVRPLSWQILHLLLPTSLFFYPFLPPPPCFSPLYCILYFALLHLSLRSALIPVTSKRYRFESLIQSLNSFFIFRFFLFEYLSHVPLHLPHTPPQSLVLQTLLSLLISPFSLLISFWVAVSPISSPSFPISPLHYSDLALSLSLSLSLSLFLLSHILY